MSEPIQRPRQFRLITLIGVVTLAAIVVRLFVAFPSQAISLLVFAAAATTMLWLVSAVSDTLAVLGRLALHAVGLRPVLSRERASSAWHRRLSIALCYGNPTTSSPAPPAFVVAVVTMTLTLLAWRPIRFLGDFFSGLPMFYGTESFWTYVVGSWNWSEWTDPMRWKFYLLWEAGSLAHWWLHFGILSILGTTGIVIRGGDWNLKERSLQLLWFAPWLMLLDLMLLFASWMLQPATVPEPSSLFTVGIFRWELWHWDCWQDQFWLQRASLPCTLVTAVFCRRIFGFSWQLATLMGVLTIPIAILGCIAWTVLFVDVMQWLGW